MLKTLTAALCFAAVTAGAQTTGKTAMKAESQATLKKEAKISLTAARATALKEVPNGRVQKSGLERENGKLVYSFDIRVAGKTGFEEVSVDALTGAVVSREHETAKTEAKEKKAGKN